MKDNTKLIEAVLKEANGWRYGTAPCETADLLGKTFHTVLQLDNSHICFSNDTDTYIYYHAQDCCEHVYIESVVGELADLENSPLTMAELNTTTSGSTDYDGSSTWSFYKFATIKGYVDIRWCGSSNGYYSETVDMLRKPTAELLGKGAKA